MSQVRFKRTFCAGRLCQVLLEVWRRIHSVRPGPLQGRAEGSGSLPRLLHHHTGVAASTVALSPQLVYI